jgi:hypothetical protein
MDSIKSEVFSLFITNVLPPLATALVGAAAAALGYLTVLLKRKAEAEKAGIVQRAGLGAIAMATEVMKNVVAHVEVELRPSFQKATDDGVLTPEEAKALKAEAIAIFKRELGDQGLNALKTALGGSTEGFISGLLERVLAGFKNDATSP